MALPVALRWRARRNHLRVRSIFEAMEKLLRWLSRSTRVSLVAGSMLVVVSAASVLALTSPSRPDEEKPPRPLYRFDDVTRRAGIYSTATPTWGSVVADHDRDGSPDLLLVRHKRASVLYAGRTGRFAEVRTDEFYPPDGRWYYDRHACAWGEADGDGKPDLMCVSGAQKGVGIGPNQLFLGRSWAEVAARSGVADPYGRGRSINWLDFDADGDLDIFIGNQIRSGAPNLTLRNDGGRFVPVDIGLTEVRATDDSSWADWDADGDPDMLILGQGLRGSSAYENQGGRFVEIQMEGVTGQPWRAGVWADFDGDGWTDLSLVDDNRVVVLHNIGGRLRTGWHASLEAGRSSAWFDVENDGDLDLFVVQGRRLVDTDGNEPDVLYLNRAGRFELRDAGVAGLRRGDGDAVAAGDLDGDGRTDLFVTNGFGESHRGRPLLWRNRSTAGRSITVDLFGPKWNPFGFGAVIEVRAGGRQWTRRITDGTGGRVQSHGGNLFGLGEAEVASLRITWPSGVVDCLVVDPLRVKVAVAMGRQPCQKSVLNP